MDNTFRRVKKIKREQDISSIIKSGQRWKCDIFGLMYKKNSKGFDRAAIIVSKKNGSAVYRNKIKRVFREVFRHTEVVNPPFFDILICPHYSSSLPSKIIKEKYETWRKNLDA